MDSSKGTKRRDDETVRPDDKVAIFITLSLSLSLSGILLQSRGGLFGKSKQCW